MNSNVRVRTFHRPDLRRLSRSALELRSLYMQAAYIIYAGVSRSVFVMTRQKMFWRHSSAASVERHYAAAYIAYSAQH